MSSKPWSKRIPRSELVLSRDRVCNWCHGSLFMAEYVYAHKDEQGAIESMYCSSTCAGYERRRREQMREDAAAEQRYTDR